MMVTEVTRRRGIAATSEREILPFVDALAEALFVDTAMLVAIASREVRVEGIMTRHPAGGHITLSTLAEWQELLRDVADEGSSGYLARLRRDEEESAARGKEKREAANVAKMVKPERPYVLYRLFDAEERVLYLGISRNPEARLRAHRRKWGSLIASVTVEEFANAEDMMAAERAAIKAENPPLNIEGVDGDYR